MRLADSLFRLFPRKLEPRPFPCRRRGGGQNLDPRLRGDERRWGAAALLLVLTAAAPALAYEIPPIEPVYAVTAGKDGVTVRLASNGCTRKADLTIAVDAGVRPLLLIARKRPDACRSFAAGHADIAWTWTELGLKPGQAFSLANPLVMDPSP